MTTARVIPSGGTRFLVERAVQVAALQALVDAARSGSGRFVVIEGTAGIGKTRLLAEARAVAGAAEMRVRDARREGPAGLGKTRLLAEARAIAGAAEMRVLTARGGELEGEFAYGIVRQLFEALLAAAPPALPG